MADTKISALTALTGANVDSANDVLAIVDNSVTTTKKITRAQLFDISDAAGGQIVFPSTQNASSGANTLDDYEEGTWTPEFTFATPGDLNIAYSTQAGSYTKIGRQVTLWFNIITSTFTHGTAAGAGQITGLPFTAAATIFNVGSMEWSGITLANYTNHFPTISPSTATINIQTSGSGQTSGQDLVASFPTGGTLLLRGCITYNV